MPYILKKDRKAFDKSLKEIGDNLETVGELNYCFTVLLKRYLKYQGKSYKTINDCIGVLESAKLEFYRREAAIYEDLKIDINGDITIEEF